MKVDYKKIAKAWDEQKPSGRSGGKSFWLAIRTAIEKQIQKKPIDQSKKPEDWHVMACPCCEKVFWNSGQFVRYQPKFCNGCGQAIDWGEWE